MADRIYPRLSQSDVDSHLDELESLARAGQLRYKSDDPGQIRESPTETSDDDYGSGPTGPWASPGGDPEDSVPPGTGEI